MMTHEVALGMSKFLLLRGHQRTLSLVINAYCVDFTYLVLQFRMAEQSRCLVREVGHFWMQKPLAYTSC